MVSEITANLGLVDACKAFKVKELHVFGSVVNSELDDINDLDFLVVFDRVDPEGAFRQFMGFKNRLESIFQKQVDLITQKKFRNHLFEEELNRTKQLVYAA